MEQEEVSIPSGGWIVKFNDVEVERVLRLGNIGYFAPNIVVVAEKI